MGEGKIWWNSLRVKVGHHFIFLKVLICESGTDRDVPGADLAWSRRGGRRACQPFRGEKSARGCGFIVLSIKRSPQKMVSCNGHVSLESCKVNQEVCKMYEPSSLRIWECRKSWRKWGAPVLMSYRGKNSTHERQERTKKCLRSTT